MMTKKDFIAIAKILQSEKVNVKIAIKFADLFSSDNPLFDKIKFVKACYWKPFEE